MALHRLIVFVFAAVALAGCCASGTGCPASLPPELATSDGLVSSRDDGMRVDEPSMGDRSKAAMMTEPGKNTRRSARSNANQSFDEKEAMDREADAELTRHLKICSGCGPSGSPDKMANSPGKMADDAMDDGVGGSKRPRGMSKPKTRDMSNSGE